MPARVFRATVKAAAAILVAAATHAQSDPEQLRVAPDGTEVAFGSLADAVADVKVRVAGQSAHIAGQFEARDGIGIFRPLFPLKAGLRFEAVVLPSCADALDCTPLAVVPFDGPSREPVDDSPLSVTFQPSAESIPENTLRIYLRFSRPMARGQLAQHVRLLHDDGSTVRSPFLNLNVELWDPAQMRATIYFDPGRLKRDVGPNLEAGPPLEEGRTYELVVDADMRDAEGNSIGKPARLRFTVGPPERRRIDPAEWRLHSPSPRTRDEFRVDFGRVMDVEHLKSRLALHGSGGEVLPGTVRIEDGGRTWVFAPTDPWPDTAPVLQVAPLMEDVAGNTLRMAFDAGPGEAVETPETVSIPVW